MMDYRCIVMEVNCYRMDLHLLEEFLPSVSGKSRWAVHHTAGA